METLSVEKKSPIELLIEQLYKKGFLKEVDGNEPINLMNQAKEMHKQEIMNAYLNGRYEADKIVMSERFYTEQYYKETFGGKL
jgi:hypothetical protein